VAWVAVAYLSARFLAVKLTRDRRWIPVCASGRHDLEAQPTPVGAHAVIAAEQLEVR